MNGVAPFFQFGFCARTNCSHGRHRLRALNGRKCDGKMNRCVLTEKCHSGEIFDPLKTIVDAAHILYPVDSDQGMGNDFGPQFFQRLSQADVLPLSPRNEHLFPVQWAIFRS